MIAFARLLFLISSLIFSTMSLLEYTAVRLDDAADFGEAQLFAIWAAIPLLTLIVLGQERNEHE